MDKTDQSGLNSLELEKSAVFLLEALADILAAGGPPFRAALEELRSLLKDPALLEPSRLKRHAFNLAEELSQIKTRAEAGPLEIKDGPAETEPRLGPPGLADFLENLIKTIGSLRPGDYGAREQELLKNLRGGRTLEELFPILSSFIIQVREDIWSEKARAVDRIGEALREIEATERCFFDSVAETQTHLENNERRFTMAVADGLQELGSLIEPRQADLGDLCSRLSEKINKLHAQAELKKKTDQARYDSLEREKRTAAKRLAKTKRDYEEFNAQSHEMLREIEALRAISLRDPLTGIYNRRAYDRQIAATIAAVEAGELKTAALAVFDIDHFHTFNNAYGHLAGDLVLKHVARVTAETLRSDDLFFRYGGDEFVIVMPNAGLKTAWSVAEKVRLNLSGVEFKVFRNRDQVVKLTISMGVAEADKNDESGSLFQRADRALYVAKRSGRNQAKTEPPLN